MCSEVDTSSWLRTAYIGGPWPDFAVHAEFLDIQTKECPCYHEEIGAIAQSKRKLPQ